MERNTVIVIYQQEGQAMKRSSLSVLPKGIREDVEGVLRPDTEEIRVRANRPVQLRGPQSILLNR